MVSRIQPSPDLSVSTLLDWYITGRSVWLATEVTSRQTSANGRFDGFFHMVYLDLVEDSALTE